MARLRAQDAELTETNWEGFGDGLIVHRDDADLSGNLWREAADEIERLGKCLSDVTTELRNLKAATEAHETGCVLFDEPCDALKAERAYALEMRAHLQALVGAWESNMTTVEIYDPLARSAAIFLAKTNGQPTAAEVTATGSRASGGEWPFESASRPDHDAVGCPPDVPVTEHIQEERK